MDNTPINLLSPSYNAVLEDIRELETYVQPLPELPQNTPNQNLVPIVRNLPNIDDWDHLSSSVSHTWVPPLASPTAKYYPAQTILEQPFWPQENPSIQGQQVSNVGVSSHYTTSFAPPFQSCSASAYAPDAQNFVQPNPQSQGGLAQYYPQNPGSFTQPYSQSQGGVPQSYPQSSGGFTHPYPQGQAGFAQFYPQGQGNRNFETSYPPGLSGPSLEEPAPILTPLVPVRSMGDTSTLMTSSTTADSLSSPPLLKKILLTPQLPSQVPDFRELKDHCLEIRKAQEAESFTIKLRPSVQMAAEYPPEPTETGNLSLRKAWKLARGEHIPTVELRMLVPAAEAVPDSYVYVASLLSPYMDIDTRVDFVRFERPPFCVGALALAAILHYRKAKPQGITTYNVFDFILTHFDWYKIQEEKDLKSLKNSIRAIMIRCTNIFRLIKLNPRRVLFSQCDLFQLSDACPKVLFHYDFRCVYRDK